MTGARAAVQGVRAILHRAHGRGGLRKATEDSRRALGCRLRQEPAQASAARERAEPSSARRKKLEMDAELASKQMVEIRREYSRKWKEQKGNAAAGEVERWEWT